MHVTSVPKANRKDYIIFEEAINIHVIYFRQPSHVEPTHASDSCVLHSSFKKPSLPASSDWTDNAIQEQLLDQNGFCRCCDAWKQRTTQALCNSSPGQSTYHAWVDDRDGTLNKDVMMLVCQSCHTRTDPHYLMALHSMDWITTHINDDSRLYIVTLSTVTHFRASVLQLLAMARVVPASVSLDVDFPFYTSDDEKTSQSKQSNHLERTLEVKKIKEKTSLSDKKSPKDTDSTALDKNRERNKDRTETSHDKSREKDKHKDKQDKQDKHHDKDKSDRKRKEDKTEGSSKKQKSGATSTPPTPDFADLQ